MNGKLRDVSTLEGHAAFRRRQSAHQRAHQRSFAHAVVAEDADKFALAHGEIDAHQNRHAAVARTEISRGENFTRWRFLAEVHAATFLPR
jgi:hypothetical protein